MCSLFQTGTAAQCILNQGMLDICQQAKNSNNLRPLGRLRVLKLHPKEERQLKGRAGHGVVEISLMTISLFLLLVNHESELHLLH